MLSFKNANATTYTWVGGSGNWNVASNWFNNSTSSTNHGYPGGSAVGDIVVFQTYYPNTYPYINTPTLTATLPYTIAQIQTGAFAATNIGLNSGTLLTVTTGFNIAGTYGLAYDGLTFSGSGAVTVSGTITLNYWATLTVGGSNTLNVGQNTTITQSSNNCIINNNGTMNLNGTAGNLVTATLGYYGQFNNSGTLTATYTTFAFSANNGVFANTGTVTTTSCAFNLSNQACGVTNSGTLGNFTANATTFTIGSQNICYITNGTGSTFTAQAGSAITMTSYQGYITNAGTFLCGVSGSLCTITISSQYGSLTNTGIFKVGPASGITMTYIFENVTNSSGTFTFQSDNTGSAYAGKITPIIPANETPVFTGSFNVERYLTGGAAKYRAYRLLSSPVYVATLGGSGYKVSNLDYIKASVLVSGVSSTGGFDKVANPSIYMFREDQGVSNATFTSGNFWGVSKLNNSPTYNLYFNGGSTNYNIYPGEGMFIFFRGDRTTNLPNKYTPGTSAESVTLTAIGSLNQGQITTRNWYSGSTNLGYSTITGPPSNATTRGLNLVGNPYASSINWDTYNNTASTTGIYCSSNLSSSIYVLDPVSKNYGVYSALGPPGTHGTTSTIPSGQGFFVQVLDNSVSGFITFNESAKTTGQVTGSNLLLGKPTDLATLQYLRLKLSKDSDNNDDLVIRFTKTASTAYVVNEDAAYKQGEGEVSLCSISSNNVDLAINNMPLPKNTSAIGLYANANADGVYKLNLTQIVGVPQLYDIWLKDAYKKDSLDMRHNPVYLFNVYRADTNSFGAKRFTLIIRQNPAYAYHLLNFTASKIAAVTQVQVVWKTENEANYTNFAVQRSTDGGKTFDIIGSQTASDQGTYSLVDKSPISGQNIYKLQQVDLNGTITYSAPVTVMYSDKTSAIANTGKLSVYPNPATSVINLAIANDINSSSYKISITNSSGLVIKQATADQNTWQTNLSNLLPGTYLIQVVDNKDKSLVGESKFVKL